MKILFDENFGLPSEIETDDEEAKRFDLLMLNLRPRQTHSFFTVDTIATHPPTDMDIPMSLESKPSSKLLNGLTER